MFQDKRILITGSEGFIGSHLADALKDNCKDLYCVDKVNGETKSNDDSVCITFTLAPDFLNKRTNSAHL